MPSGTSIPAEPVVPRLEKLLTKVLSRRRVRNAAVGAAAVDGSWEWIEAAGRADADGTPMEPTTPWFLASVTKLYTASVILRLHEQRLVDLDAPIPGVLPAGLQAGAHVLDGVDRTAQITVPTCWRTPRGCRIR